MKFNCPNAYTAHAYEWITVKANIKNTCRGGQGVIQIDRHSIHMNNTFYHLLLR
jgi:hypothetical protein